MAYSVERRHTQERLVRRNMSQYAIGTTDCVSVVIPTTATVAPSQTPIAQDDDIPTTTATITKEESCLGVAAVQQHSIQEDCWYILYAKVYVYITDTVLLCM